MATGDTALRFTPIDSSNGESLGLTSAAFDYNEEYTVSLQAYVVDTSTGTQTVFEIVSSTEEEDRDTLQWYYGEGFILRSVNQTGGSTDNRGYLSGLQIGAWMSVAVVRSGGALKLYVDGVDRATANITLTSRTPSTNFHIARRLIGGISANFGNLRAKHLKVWSRALTLDELSRENQQGAPLDHTELYGYWPFDDGDDSDHSGNGHDFTSENSPTVEEGPGIPLSLYAPLVIQPGSITDFVGTPEPVARIFYSIQLQ